MSQNNVIGQFFQSFDWVCFTPFSSLGGQSVVIMSQSIQRSNVIKTE